MEGLMSLLASTEYEGLVIKEWNILQFAKLSKSLQDVAKKYKEQNVQWEGFSALLEKAEKEGIASMSENVLDMIAPFLEHAPVIIQVSCNVDQKKLESIPYTSGLIALMLILKANLEHLNRFFGNLVAAKTPEVATASIQ